jgi:hypothetical protein
MPARSAEKAAARTLAPISAIDPVDSGIMNLHTESTTMRAANVEARLEIYLLFGGLLLYLIGHLWLIIRCFKQGFGFGLLAMLPVLYIFLLILSPRRAVRPLLVMLVGLLLAAGPVIVNRLMPIDLGPIETVENGDQHITLTGWDDEEKSLGLFRRVARSINKKLNGWDRYDYSVLEQKTNVVVLQMANPDVTDDTLLHLTNLNKLRELDLSETSITDKGLKTLLQLPNLEWLRLNRTAVTDDGVREYLMAKKSLKKLEVTDTKVSAEMRSAWRKAEPGRRTMPTH